MAALYTYSYVGILLSTLLWFFLNAREQSTTPIKMLFWSSLGVYSISMFFGDGSSLYKMLIILPRDIAIYVLIALLANKFAARLGSFAVLALALGSVMTFYYFDVLLGTFGSESSELSPDAELIVDLKKDSDPASVEAALEEYRCELIPAFPRLQAARYASFTDNYIINVPDEYADDIDDIIDLLQSDANVDWVERNEIIQLDPDEDEGSEEYEAADYGVNDPDVGKLWGFGRMKMAEFYQTLARLRPRKQARIAILDTGVDAEHPDLKRNYVSSDRNSDRDVVGHGTHCAGIAAAVSNNRIGIASFAPKQGWVEVTSIKVLDDRGTGTDQGIIAGIIRAADEDADIISLSLGGRSDDEKHRAFGEAVEYANDKGAIVVAAAGNSSANARHFAPAGTKGVIAVAAVDNELNRAAFSNSVADLDFGIAAPGVDIYSTYPGDAYKLMSGTSMSAPYVAGLLGIMKALRPALNTADAYKLLQTSGLETDDGEATGRFIQPAALLQKLQ